MPDFPLAITTPRVETNSFNVNFIGVGGDKSSTGIEFDDLVSSAELTAWRTAIASLSNAGVFKTTGSYHVEIPQYRAGPLDEAHSSVKEKLIMVFQNADLDIKEFGIPAPDASYFVGDGITAVTPDNTAATGTPARLLATAVYATRIILNNGAAATGGDVGTYEYVRGYRSRPGMRRPRFDPTFAYEPTPTTEPGPESDPEGDEGL
jgi:hypothetical protein